VSTHAVDSSSFWPATRIHLAVIVAALFWHLNQMLGNF
jgi:hypothetical protein